MTATRSEGEVHGFVTRLLGALEDLLGGRVLVISNDIHCDRLLLYVLGGATK